MKKLKSLLFFSLVLFLFSSCSNNPLRGTWQYNGGLYNGREQKAPTDIKMQRTYSSDSYEAFLIETSKNPELYNSGIYKIVGDTLFITSKFSSRPSQNTDVTIKYNFKVANDKLLINGVLPNGMQVEEYWIKVN